MEIAASSAYFVPPPYPKLPKSEKGLIFLALADIGPKENGWNVSSGGGLQSTLIWQMLILLLKDIKGKKGCKIMRKSGGRICQFSKEMSNFKYSRG